MVEKKLNEGKNHICDNCHYAFMKIADDERYIACGCDKGEWRYHIVGKDHTCERWSEKGVTEVCDTFEKMVCGNCLFGRKIEECEVGVVCTNGLSRYKGMYMKKDGLCNLWVYEKVDLKMKSEEGEVSKENIDHPERYTKNNMECIQEMVEVFGIDAVISFCKCNVWKYRYRTTCDDDLKKADWYMNKLVQLKQKKEGLS